MSGSIGGCSVDSGVVSGIGDIGGVNLNMLYNVNRGEVGITDLTDLLITV